MAARDSLQPALQRLHLERGLVVDLAEQALAEVGDLCSGKAAHEPLGPRRSPPRGRRARGRRARGRACGSPSPPARGRSRPHVLSGGRGSRGHPRSGPRAEHTRPRARPPAPLTASSGRPRAERGRPLLRARRSSVRCAPAAARPSGCLRPPRRESALSRRQRYPRRRARELRFCAAPGGYTGVVPSDQTPKEITELVETVPGTLSRLQPLAIAGAVALSTALNSFQSIGPK